MTPRQQQLLPDVIIPERTSKRHRFQFKFWLDCSKDDELLLAEEADELKRHRQWQPTIRDAFKLIISLREKRVDVMLSLFPWIDEYFRVKYAHQDSPAVSEFTRLMEQQTAILAQLAQRQTVPALPAPRFDMPVFDDDDLPTIQLKRNTTTDSAGNFLNSLSALAGNAFVDAAPDDGKQARATFAASMGNLFADDDE